MPTETALDARLLQAGPLTCWLVGPDLRRVSLHGQEVIQRIYFAVRDATWHTIPLGFEYREVVQNDDGFSVEIDLTSQGPVGFRARISLRGTAQGQLHVRCLGVAESSFRRMRIGWCILHPQHLAGTPLTVGHDTGADDQVMLPHLLEPWLVATDIRWLETGPSDARVRLGFFGEKFETEDQRNYGDASFKTYGTLSALPRPVMVQKGEELDQGLTMIPCGPPAGAVPLSPSQAQAPSPSRSQPRVIRLRMADTVQPCARIGHLETGSSPTSAGPDSHRLVQLDFTASWRERLAAAESARARDGAPTVITVFAEQLTTVNAVALAHHLPPDSEVLVYDDPDGQALLRLRATVPPEILVGHGSRFHFNDVNRGPRLISDLLGFSINPVVHADDSWSLLENTAAFAHIVASAKMLNPHLRIGPVMLPADDVRMQTDVGAIWLIAVLAHLLPGLDDNDAVTLAPQSELTAKPASAVLQTLRTSRGLRQVMGDTGQVAALALDTARGTRVLLANTDHQPISVLISGLRHGAEAVHLGAWAWTMLDG